MSRYVDKIALGEDTVLELKAVRFSGDRVVAPTREDLADELAALANTRDAVLVLGVDDRTREVGIPIDRLDVVEEFVRTICQDSIKPPLVATIIRMRLPGTDGGDRAVINVDVPRSLYVHKSPGGYFHRVGSSKRELSTEYLFRLGQQRSQSRIIRFDEQVVATATIATSIARSTSGSAVPSHAIPTQTCSTSSPWHAPTIKASCVRPWRASCSRRASHGTG